MRPLYLFSTFLGLTSAASVALNPREPAASSSSSGACNNSPDLCGKQYPSVVHLGCHNSAFVRDATTGFSTSGNQYYNSTVQLSAGVRLLTAQVHKSNGGWHLCHSSCDLLDAGLLSNWLKTIKEWMDANPNEVVTILLVNSDKASASELHNEFSKSGITSYAYYPPTTADAPALGSWPTLGSMISSGKRLVTFIASIDPGDASGEMAYMIPEFAFIFENAFENMKPADFQCTPNRPSGLTIDSAFASNRMAFMNHFLYQSLNGVLSDIETPNVDDIATTNSPSSSQVGMLGNAADMCTSQYGGRPPTFILVDFFDEGPALQTIDRLNGVTNPVGRTAVPPRSQRGVGNTAASWVGVQNLVQQVVSGETPSLGAWIWGSGKWTLGGINLSGGAVIS